LQCEAELSDSQLEFRDKGMGDKQKWRGGMVKYRTGQRKGRLTPFIMRDWMHLCCTATVTCT